MSSRPYRILLVDDTPAIHDDLRKVLGCANPDARTTAFDALDAELFGAQEVPHQIGLRCDSAYQGEAGLTLVERACAEGDPYTVAIVDMRMPPGWDGVETIRHLWAVDPELQVVICTAHADWTWTQIIDALGERDNLLILKKPFAPVEVNQMVLALVQKWTANQKLRAYTRELEDRVAERTRSLVEANARLTHEIAERERVEDALRLSQRLESLGHLAAGVAHEINNPLQYIMCNHDYSGELLDQLVADEATPEAVKTALGDAREVVRETRAGLVRIADIVRDLRTYARDAGQRNERLDVHDVVRASLKIAAHETRDMTVEVDLGAVAPVHGAPTRLGQVVVNLIVNAAQALRASGRPPVIRVVTRLDAAHGMSVIEVIDGGPGIPKDLLTKIFDPFFTTKGPGGGTGLGLSISRNIVIEMGGAMEIDSVVGEGSTFRVQLPALGAVAVASDARHVFVIDDDPRVTSHVRALLGAFSVQAVHDAGEAIERLAAGAPADIVCCDLALPGMSGVELYERVCARRPELAPRFIFMSSTQGSTRGTVAGPMLAKPVESAALLREIDAMLA